jgi:formate dehydrogenase major subunit
VQACPTATLTEKSVIEQGQAERSVTTTCAYCGVGCSFKAEVKGEKWCAWCRTKDGGANPATPASRAASPGVTPPTPTASPRR